MVSRTSQDSVRTTERATASADYIKKEVSHVERIGMEKDHMDYDRVDSELAKYANAVPIDISTEENLRLKRMIDRRVLPIMVFTYFLQALDKGTVSPVAIVERASI